MEPSPEKWEAVKALLEKALEVAPSERSRFLKSACHEEDVLLEAQRLLAEFEQAGSFLSRPVLEPMRECEALSISPGAKLGPYEILERIGKGGMGEVYRARDSRLRRIVAVKILPIEVRGDASSQARFEREARAASALNHPNIISVYDVGQQDGICFIVSEFIEAESLRSLIEHGPVEAGKLINAAIQISEGLKAAHEAGIVHRDLKPENIMFTRDGRVKILDFGLAKRTSLDSSVADSTETQIVTAHRAVMGTVGYMSPEQVRGEPADARSDIFSLGVVLYEMASGQRAFAGGNSIEVLSAVLRDEVPKLTDVPPELGRIILRCVEKQPENRFESSAELLGALEGARERLATGRRSRPGLALGTLAGAAVLAAGIIGIVYKTKPRAPAPERAISQPYPVMSDHAGQLPVAPPIATTSVKPTGCRGTKPAALKRAESTPEPPLPASAPSVGRSVIPEPGPQVASDRMKSVTIDLGRALAEARYADVLANLTEVAKAAVAPDIQRKWDQARQEMGSIRWVSPPFVHSNTEFVWFELARGIIDVRVEFGKDERVSALYYWFYHTGALQEPEASAASDPARAREADDRAEQLLSQEKYDDALKSFDEAIQQNAQYAEAYRGRCAAHVRLRQYAAALMDCTHAIHLLPTDAKSYRWRGDASAGFRHWEYAIPAYDEAIRRQPGDNVFFNQRAWVNLNQGRYDLCVEDASAGLQLNPRNVALWTNRSSCYEHLQKYDLATQDATQLINLTRDAKDYNRRGSLYTEAKDYQRAIADFNEAIRLKPDYKDAYNARGFAKDMLGDAVGAAADRKYARELP